MKKTTAIFAFVLVVSSCLGLCACGQTPMPAETVNAPTVIITETTAVYTAEASSETSESEASTDSRKTAYTSVTQIPKIYRMEKNGYLPKEAASYIADAMLYDLRNPDAERTFTFSDHELKALSLSPSSDVLKEGNRHGALNSALVADNTYIVHLNFKFSYSGEYAGIEDESGYYEFREVEEDVPLILMETDSEYLLWWTSAYGETNYPSEVEALIGKEILFPSETEAPDTRHQIVASVPGVYRVEKGGLSLDKAAEVLIAEMLDAMSDPSDDRTFRVLEYRDPEIKVFPSSEMFASDDPVCAKNTYAVSLRAEFRYLGTYSPIGTNTDESKWWEGLRPGGEGANMIVLLETEEEYIMWWKNAYKVQWGEGTPYPSEAEGLFEY